MNIAVILGATRPGRMSDRVATYLRRKLDARSIAGELIDLREVETGRWRVEFGNGAGERHALDVVVDASGPMRPPSCGAAAEPTASFRIA